MASLSLSVAGLAAVLAFATVSVAPFVVGAPPEPQGHLILQVEGDARALAVVRITPKPDPCGRAVFQSEFQAVVRDVAGAELGSVPIDMRGFDMDPAHVGNGIRVEGCALTDTRVAMLVSVPRWPNAGSIEIRRNATVLGRIAGVDLTALVRAGEVR